MHIECYSKKTMLSSLFLYTCGDFIELQKITCKTVGVGDTSGVR